MFKEGSFVTAIGKFMVVETEGEYIQFDPQSTGETESVKAMEENGFHEIDAVGKEKTYDGFQIGDFFIFNGKYKVIRSNEVFTKIELDGQMLSLPNNKLMEVA